MKNILKQLEELAINFKNNYFFNTKIKLSIYYAFIMLIVLTIFSIVIYGISIKNLSDSFDDQSKMNDPKIKNEINAFQDRLQITIISTDLFVFILTLILSYYLSSKTLKPIKTAYLKQKKFVADSAHEFRTPLAIMKTGSEMILNSNANNAEYKKLIHEQIEEIDYLTEMINELLFLAKNDDIKNITFEEFNLSNLIKKQIESIMPYAKIKSINLDFKITDEIYFNGNSIYLKKLINNLIKNAIDYNKLNGSVIVSLEKIKQNIVLSIKDTGIGISKEDLRYIFDRFYKVDKSRARESNGSGLGLSIVSEIIKIHNGKISVVSKEGLGSEFTVLFSSYNSHI